MEPLDRALHVLLIALVVCGAVFLIDVYLSKRNLRTQKERVRAGLASYTSVLTAEAERRRLKALAMILGGISLGAFLIAWLWPAA